VDKYVGERWILFALRFDEAIHIRLNIF